MKLYWGMFCLFFTVIVLLSLVLADEELLKIDKTSQPSDYYDPKLREMWQVDVS